MQIQGAVSGQPTILCDMRNEKLMAALTACATLLFIVVWGLKGPPQNLWWAVILTIFFGPVAVGGYVIVFYIVGYLSEKLKMNGLFFSVFASTALGSLVFAVATGFGFISAFSRGKFNPKLMQWGMERSLMLVGAVGGAIGGIAFYATRKHQSTRSQKASSRS
jgi:hypothetical protein